MSRAAESGPPREGTARAVAILVLRSYTLLKHAVRVNSCSEGKLLHNTPLDLEAYALSPPRLPSYATDPHLFPSLPT